MIFFGSFFFLSMYKCQDGGGDSRIKEEEIDVSRRAKCDPMGQADLRNKDGD